MATNESQANGIDGGKVMPDPPRDRTLRRIIARHPHLFLSTAGLLETDEEQTGGAVSMTRAAHDDTAADDDRQGTIA